MELILGRWVYRTPHDVSLPSYPAGWFSLTVHQSDLDSTFEFPARGKVMLDVGLEVISELKLPTIKHHFVNNDAYRTNMVCLIVNPLSQDKVARFEELLQRKLETALQAREQLRQQILSQLQSA